MGISLLVLAGLLAANWQLLPVTKHVTLILDDSSHELQISARNIQDMLNQLRVKINPYDAVSPALNTRLQNNMTVTVEHARAVIIQADGQRQVIYTTSDIPAKWLEVLGIAIPPNSLLYADGLEIQASEPSNARFLLVVNPVEVTLAENNQEHDISVQAATVGQALWQSGIALIAADRITPPLASALLANGRINIQSSKKIQVKSISGISQFLSTAATVGEALADGNFSLQGMDYSIPAEDQPIPANNQIQIVHVEEKILSNQVVIPYQVEYQADPNTEIDSQSIITAGRVGIQEQRVRIRYEDGVETSRTDEGSYLIRSPQNQINGYGTKIVMHTLETPDGVINYWRAIVMWATSYYPAELGGSTTTASGMKLTKGIVAVDKRYIPFYTQLYIPGYGQAVAADTGGGVIGRMIDLGYDDANYVSWHQNVTVYFLWPPPANIVWIFP